MDLATREINWLESFNKLMVF